MKTHRIALIGIALVGFMSCNDRVEEKLKTVYAAEPRNNDTFSVTSKFGKLTVREGEFSGESTHKPWSSWWYPLNEKTMFEGKNGEAAPLEKYDFFVGKKFDEYSDAASYEAQNIYQANEVAWAGLCHAWAIASVLHPEPSSTKYLAGVKFKVSDQKALLLKSYEVASGISKIMYGSRYNGNRTDDYDDIYPDQFHKLAQHHVIENQKSFLMDYDPRYPVWTVPVYKVKFQIKKIDNSTAQVNAWITFASPHVETFDFVGTKRVVKNYKYLLKGQWKGGVLEVSKGEWIGDSKQDHPDYLISYPDSIARGSRNQHLKAEYIDAILK